MDGVQHRQLYTDVALARRHVADAEARVSELRARVMALRATGEDAWAATRLLHAFEDMLATMRWHLRLEEARKGNVLWEHYAELAGASAK